MRYAAMPATGRQAVEFPALLTGMDTRSAHPLVGEYALAAVENLWEQEGGWVTRPGFTVRSRFERQGETPQFLFAEEGTEATWWRETFAQSGKTYLQMFRLNRRGERDAILPPLEATTGTVAPWKGGYLAVVDTGLFFIEGVGGSWRGYSAEAYVPTVMRNGRGCLPGDVQPTDWNPGEDYNTLTNRFLACYTTDGMSSRFFLPVGELNNDTVTATLREGNGEIYTYTVAAGRTDSGLAGGRFMRVNRTGGFVQFLGSDDLPNPPDTNGMENNLTLSAAKNGVGGPSPLGGVQWCRWIKGDSGHSLLLFGGNPDTPARICWLRPQDGLYLPAGQSLYIGDEHSGITAMVPLREKWLVFKSQAVYLLTVGAGASAKPERLRVTLYPSAVGCANPAALQVGDDRVMWLDTDGRVRQLTGDGISRRQSPDWLSAPIADQLAQLTDYSRRTAEALWWRGRYLLRVGQTVWVCDPAGERPVWSRWILPDEVKAAVWTATEGGITLLCRETEGDSPVWVVGHLTPAADGVDEGWNGGDITAIPIPFRLATKDWPIGPSGCSVRPEGLRVDGQVTGRPLQVSVRTEWGRGDGLRLPPSCLGKRIPWRPGRNRLLTLEMSGTGPARLNKVTLWRRILSRDR